MTRDQAKATIEKLVERFREHRHDYHLPDYNEAKTRQDFINPFFKALGWDIDNEKGDSEAYREVIYEDKVVVKGKAKAPDYGFRLSGSAKKRLFYVEAKKPSVSLRANKESAYQLRRYGSSAQAYVSILTNFEDFIIYDCSRVPNLHDSASVSKLKHIHFEKYLEEFDFIFDTFSHEAVTHGKFDKYVQSDTNKKGSQTLDKEFVQSLDEWRRYLAVSIAHNNRKLNDEEINFAVQQTIDRLIFLRFCEDRAVEPYAQLQKEVSKGNAYQNLFHLFKLADDKYNSGLFDFKKDVITPHLKIDNKVIKSIIEDLYYPLCRYEFSVMPVEVLGNAYEQFLGKVIRITPARSVRIEEKPEVRKAGGVYYTPQYIVEYIVKNTVGKLVDEKSPKEIEKLKIVDPACGSGSFLVGAFEYLLNHHINWYHNKGYATKKGKDNPFTPQGTLTTHEKKRILLNNIFGVDIDANAVEVTKLSLLLKCMEGETEASIKQQMSMFHERVLPDLDNNVKEGNSLIDTDFYDEFDLGFEKKIKPFSWRKGFPNVFKPKIKVSIDQGVDQKKLKELLKDVNYEIFQTNNVEQQWKYKKTPKAWTVGESAIGGDDVIASNEITEIIDIIGKKSNADIQHIHSAFISKADYFITNDKNDLINNGKREKLEKLTKVKIRTLEELEKEIFKQGGFDAIIGNPPYVLVGADIFSKDEIEYFKHYSVAQYKVDLYHLFIERGVSLLNDEGLLGFILPSTWMTQQFTDQLRKFVLSKSKINQVFNLGFKVFEQADVYTEIIILNNKVPAPSEEIQFLSASSFDNFHSPISLKEKQSIFLKKEGFIIDGRTLSTEGKIVSKISARNKRLEELARASLGCQAYNSSKHSTSQIENRVFHSDKKSGKEYLEELAGNDVGRYYLERKKGQWIKYGSWLHDYRSMDWLTGSRILVREITGKAPYKIQATYTEKTYCNYKTILNVNPSGNTKFSVKYLCGLLNSKLLSFIFSYSSNKIEANSFPRISVGDIKKLPIKDIDIKNKEEKYAHDEIVKNVDLLLQLNEELREEKLQNKIEQIKQRIAHSEEKINELVYELYELTPEEIKIVNNES